MYEEAETVYYTIKDEDLPQSSQAARRQQKSPQAGVGTSGPPPQPRPVPQSGSHGRVRHGNGASDHDKQQEDQDTSSHTYENDEEVKHHATSAKLVSSWRVARPCAAESRLIFGRTSHESRPYFVFENRATVAEYGRPSRELREIFGRPSSVRIRPRPTCAKFSKSCVLRASFMPVSDEDRAYPGGASGRRGVCSFLRARPSCLAAGIAVLLSLCAVGLAPLTFSNKQEISQLSTTVQALKRGQDALRRMSTTVDALKRDQDGMSTSVDALKRGQDALRRMSTTVDALKRDQDGMSTSVDALKRDQDDMSTTVDALKRDQDDMSTAVDALKRDQDGISTTVDALKRDQDDMSTTVDALKRDQDDMPTTVDALKRDQDDMSTTVDALKRDLDNERSRTATLEKRLPKNSKTSGYTKWRGTCYKAFNTAKTFDQATAACRADGGTLAMPRDAETNAFLVSLYNSVNEREAFWFGLHYRHVEGRFEWVDGSALGSYNSWGQGQPSNRRGNRDCVLYSAYSAWKDKWVDFDCDQRSYFTCQAAPGHP
ncbi:hypothetical protein Bbelb_339040 [Branchiostoma belcheri]|nr:hypothetical protein Bbelb_339040 [Branchiostoma belcheri]